MQQSPLRYENDYFYYVWKPHGIASTFGKQESFLDVLISRVDKPIQQLQQIRWKENNEFGMVNRLDNLTGGLLFFAKTPEIYTDYKQLQEIGAVQKIYYADLYGKIDDINWAIEIDTPIYHHYSDASRMTADPKLGRDKPHQVHTQIIPYYYDWIHNYTSCKVIIQKGVRHQIRLHTASIGHHILGDILYCPKWMKAHYANPNKIHLRSTGIQINSQ